jgi:IS5 family transposase
LSSIIPDISFIVPVYNDQAYLSACIESLLTQDGVHVEIIIIDDGSTDKSLEIATRFAEVNDNVSVFPFENSGLSTSRNRGIERASGKYIQFVDSDDLIPNHSVAETLSIMKGNSLNSFFGSAVVVDENCDEIIANKSYFRNDSKVLNGKKSFALMLHEKYIPSACCFVVERELLSELKFYPGIYHEDNLFTTLLYLQPNNFKTLHSSKIIYIRRVRSGSITQVPTTYKHSIGYYTVIVELLKLIEESDFDELTNKNIYFLINKLLNNFLYQRLSIPARLKLFLVFHSGVRLNYHTIKLHLKNIKLFLSSYYHKG